jgi:hypothetical protein
VMHQCSSQCSSQYTAGMNHVPTLLSRHPLHLSRAYTAIWQQARVAVCLSKTLIHANNFTSVYIHTYIYIYKICIFICVYSDMFSPSSRVHACSHANESWLLCMVMHRGHTKFHRTLTLVSAWEAYDVMLFRTMVEICPNSVKEEARTHTCQIKAVVSANSRLVANCFVATFKRQV